MTAPSILTHEQANALAIEKMREISKTYGRLIFQKTVMFDLTMPQLEAGIDAAVADTRDFLVAGGICEHDVELGLYHLRLAIIQEGRRLAEQLPEYEPETVQ